MRRLFQNEGLNPRRRITAHELFGLLDPAGWDLWYWVALVIAGFAAAAYAVARLIVHFAELGQWWHLSAVATCAAVVAAGAWFRVPLAMLLVAVAIGLGSTVLLGGFNALLP